MEERRSPSAGGRAQQGRAVVARRGWRRLSIVRAAALQGCCPLACSLTLAVHEAGGALDRLLAGHDLGPALQQGKRGRRVEAGVCKGASGGGREWGGARRRLQAARAARLAAWQSRPRLPDRGRAPGRHASAKPRPLALTAAQAARTEAALMLLRCGCTLGGRAGHRGGHQAPSVMKVTQLGPPSTLSMGPQRQFPLAERPPRHPSRCTGPRPSWGAPRLGLGAPTCSLRSSTAVGDRFGGASKSTLERWPARFPSLVALSRVNHSRWFRTRSDTLR